jgi:phospholipid/cholesterol/gamma-HCH transport system ATP-binding protein
MLFRRKLVMFRPWQVLLTSDRPVVKQFLNGCRVGPIGMSEEKDDAQLAQEQAMVKAGQHDGGVGEIHGVPPQIQPTSGPGEPDGRQASPGPVHEIMHTLPESAQEAIHADSSCGSILCGTR